MAAFPDTKDVRADASELAADVAQLKEDIKKLSASVMGLGRDGLDAAQKGGAKQLDAWREDVDDLTKSLRKQGRHQLAVVEDQLHERPLLALLAALAVGLFLVWRLIDRR
jgi:ElaB/YqjD/DUF883 family membrane-anchored ribosome-binding protein